MTREDLRLKLQVLLGEFESDHKVKASEIHTIAATIITIIYSDKSTRLVWYSELQKTAKMIGQILKKQADRMAAALGLSKEEIEKMEQRIKSKNGKVEN